VSATLRWLSWGALLVLVAGLPACAERPTAPSLELAPLVRGWEREGTPYYPFQASESGLHQYDRVFANDIGEEYRRGLQALCTRYRDDLRRVDAAALSDAERVTYDVFRFRLETCVAGFRYPSHLIPVNQVGLSWPSRFPVMGAGKSSHPFRTVQNYRDFLGRIDGFVIWMDTAIANMRAGVARGITQPREVILEVLPQLDAQIVEDPHASMFWEPIRDLPTGVDEDTRRDLAAAYFAAIRDKIVPAYRRLRTFLHDEYLPRCRTSAGLGGLPDGRAWYAWAVRVSTTTELTPDEIYDLGVAEVARLRAAIATLRAEIADAHEPAPPRYHSVDELLAGYARLRADVDAAMPRLFGRFPRGSFEIRPIEAFREHSMPSSYEAASLDLSRPGVFYLNTVDVRSDAGAAVSRSVYLHEAVPGHHLQIMLQRERKDLPGFRRFASYTAFVEGWALYAEGLGVDLGVYPSRWDRLGMLQGELFRARRLVVDVGLHSKGWTRDRAIQYLGGSSPGNVREVERYMAWPGQALGYKIGQLKILALRRKAEAALGASFDVRTFHDELLRDGAMPLTALESKMDRWLASARRGRSA
jgi:uncharacterized protein (DUF885 family)